MSFHHSLCKIILGILGLLNLPINFRSSLSGPSYNNNKFLLGLDWDDIESTYHFEEICLHHSIEFSNPPTSHHIQK